MSILALLQQAQNGQGLGQLASQFGLDASKAEELTSLLAPAIGSAAKQRLSQGGVESLVGAFKGEDQAAMFEDAAAAAAPEGQANGAAFLASLMGSDSAAEGLATEAAQRTGIDMGTVAQFLPALAAMAQGGLQKNLPDSALDGLLGSVMGGGASSGGGLMGMIGGLLGGKSAQASAGPDLSMLTNLLDADGDGSVMDDILGHLMK